MAGSAGPGPSIAGTGKRNRFLVKFTVISTLGGLLFGHDTGVRMTSAPTTPRTRSTPPPRTSTAPDPPWLPPAPTRFSPGGECPSRSPLLKGLSWLSISTS